MCTFDAITDLSTNFDITNNNLKTLRLNNPKNVIFSYLNINSIRNKMGSLREVVIKNVNIPAIAESKIDESSPSLSFFQLGIIVLIDLINPLKVAEFLFMRIVNTVSSIKFS